MSQQFTKAVGGRLRPILLARVSDVCDAMLRDPYIWQDGAGIYHALAHAFTPFYGVHAFVHPGVQHCSTSYRYCLYVFLVLFFVLCLLAYVLMFWAAM